MPSNARWDVGVWDDAKWDTLLPIDGNAAWTEARDTWVVIGQVNISGAAAWVEARDIWVVTGAVLISGAAAWTEGRDVWNVTASVNIDGAAAWLEGQDIWAAAGVVTQPSIVGSVAWTEAQDIWAVQGGPQSVIIIDDHDGGEREKKRQRGFKDERELRKRRRAQVIAAYERIVEGKPEISEALADEIIDAVEHDQADAPHFDFEAVLARADRLQALLDDAIERDDEEVLALL